MRLFFFFLFFCVVALSCKQQIDSKYLLGSWIPKKKTGTWLYFTFLDKDSLRINTPAPNPDGYLIKTHHYNLILDKNVIVLGIDFKKFSGENARRYFLLKRVNDNTIKIQIDNSGTKYPIDWVAETELNTVVLVRR